jgi:hypothetical protein
MSKRKYHGPKLLGQWVPHPAALIRILGKLSLTARRILDTLEIENCRHGGRENGRLVCTYNDFERIVQRSRIRKALDELIAAGLIEITRVGRRAYADLHSSSLYQLTYLHTFKDGEWIKPTHEWKKQKTRPESTIGTRPESTTGNDQLPARNPPLQGANYQTGIQHSLIDIGVVGGGLAADFSSSPATPPSPSEGAGPSAPPPPSDQLPSATAPSSGRLH